MSLNHTKGLLAIIADGLNCYKILKMQIVTFSKPIIEIIQQRFSCRKYLKNQLKSKSEKGIADIGARREKVADQFIKIQML